MFANKLPKNQEVFLLNDVDLLIFGNDLDYISNIKFKLTKAFEMKDFSEIKYFLGIRIERNVNSKIIYLRQTQFIEKLI